MIAKFAVMRHFRYLPILFILFFWSCKEKVTNTKVFTSADLVNANTKLLHIAMEDGFYGGIHFYNGIEEGNKQGKFIGNAVINKLK